MHFDVCVVDGVFEEAASEEGGADADAQARAPGVIFHPATGVYADAVDEAQASLRKRILRAFVGRGLLEGFEAKEMLAYKHSGFSVDTSVCIAGHDRAGLERLLRYCARAPFAMERLRKTGGELVYRCAKQHSGPGANPHNKRGSKVDEITLTPLELIDRIAALVPPKRPAHYLWAVLIARIYEVFPLVCPNCGGPMRIIAFITYGAGIRQILEHIGVEAEPPRITPARGPPLWDGCDAQMGDGVEVAPDWDEAAQVAPDFEVDQRVSW